MTTVKKQPARSAKKTAPPPAKAAKPELTTFEQRVAPMPGLQPLRRAAAQVDADPVDAEAEAPAYQPLSEKDVILRLVEMLKSL